MLHNPHIFEPEALSPDALAQATGRRRSAAARPTMRPRNVVLVQGLQRAGKTTLINALCGSRVCPYMLTLPPVAKPSVAVRNVPFPREPPVIGLVDPSVAAGAAVGPLALWPLPAASVANGGGMFRSLSVDSDRGVSALAAATQQQPLPREHLVVLAPPPPAARVDDGEGAAGASLSSFVDVGQVTVVEPPHAAAAERDAAAVNSLVSSFDFADAPPLLVDVATPLPPQLLRSDTPEAAQPPSPARRAATLRDAGATLEVLFSGEKAASPMPATHFVTVDVATDEHSCGTDEPMMPVTFVESQALEDRPSMRFVHTVVYVVRADELLPPPPSQFLPPAAAAAAPPASSTASSLPRDERRAALVASIRASTACANANTSCFLVVNARDVNYDADEDHHHRVHGEDVHAAAAPGSSSQFVFVRHDDDDDDGNCINGSDGRAAADACARQRALPSVRELQLRLARAWHLPTENVFIFDLQRALAASAVAALANDGTTPVAASSEFRRFCAALRKNHENTAATAAAVTAAVVPARSAPVPTVQTEAPKYTPAVIRDEHEPVKRHTVTSNHDAAPASDAVAAPSTYVPRVIAEGPQLSAAARERLAEELQVEARAATAAERRLAEAVAAQQRRDAEAAARLAARAAESAASGVPRRAPYIPKVLQHNKP